MRIDERQRDYSLFFGAAAANTQQPAQQLRIDSDGPFALREVGFSGTGGVMPQSIQVKFQDNLGRFLEQDFVPTFGEMPFSGAALTNYTGFIPALTPIVPQIVYPPNSTIVVYLKNSNPAQSLTAGRMVFRGVSMHPRGTVLNGARYPRYFRELPFSYVRNVTLNSNPQVNNILNILPDADFVLRAMLFTPVTSGVIETAFGSNWLIQLKDQNGKYYQTGSNSNTIATAGIFPDSICGHVTPHIPGVICPELYLIRNSTLYYDVFTPEILPSYIQVRFIGAKIFETAQPC